MTNEFQFRSGFGDLRRSISFMIDKYDQTPRWGAIVVTRQGEGGGGSEDRGERGRGFLRWERLVVLLFLLSSGLLGILLKNLRCMFF